MGPERSLDYQDGFYAALGIKVGWELELSNARQSVDRAESLRASAEETAVRNILEKERLRDAIVKAYAILAKTTCFGAGSEATEGKCFCGATTVLAEALGDV